MICRRVVKIEDLQPGGREFESWHPILPRWDVSEAHSYYIEENKEMGNTKNDLLQTIKIILTEIINLSFLQGHPMTPLTPS